MEPVRDARVTLVDLLDRILDKGLVINSDIIISVAGIPLIGVNLRAALAGMETMLKYGMMKAWDERIRAREANSITKKEIPLLQREEVVLNMFGSCCYMKGIYNTWKSGRLCLTNLRLLLYQQDIAEVIFETPLDGIRAIAVRRERSFTGKDRDILHLYLEGKKAARLSVLETEQFRQDLERSVRNAGGTLDPQLPHEELDERINSFLMEEERLFCEGKMWHLMPKSPIMVETWRPGHLYITNRRLCWLYDFDKRIVFDIPVDKISGSTMEIKNISPLVRDKKVLDVIYGSNGSKMIASFSAKDMDEVQEWTRALNRLIAGAVRTEEDGEKATCPQCGKQALAKELLENGCPDCGWVSPRSEEEIAKVAVPAR